MAERPVLLALGDVAVLQHPVEDVGLPLVGPLRVEIGGIVARGLGESRQHGRFRQRQVPGAFPEIPLGGGLDAVGAVAEIDVVQIEGDDLLLGQIPVDLVGEERLLDLPHVALLRGEVEGLGDLLGDGASPLDDLVPPRDS